jgi:HD-GYP domain-containing protein (c-di-GMP phosphodiesterase class II)
MNETPVPRPADTRPIDERYREMGLNLMMRVLALIRVGRAYRVDNQVFRVQLDTMMKALEPLLAEAPETVLVALENDIYMNGVRLPVKSATLKHHQALLGEFRKRKIAGLRIEQGVTAEEIMKFFALFLQPEDHHGSGLLEAALAAGCVRIQPAVYASTEAPETDATMLMPGLNTDGGSHYGPAGGGGGGGGGGGELEVDTGPAVPGMSERPQPAIEEVRSASGGGPRGGTPKNYNVAMSGARSLLTTTTLQDGIEMRHAKRVVQPLVDGAFAAEPVVMGLSTLGHHDGYTYMHSVNVCIVAVTMGHLLGFDRRALSDLGVASLLHDVGKNGMAGRIRHALPAFTDEERALAETHPFEGAKLLARSTMLNATTLRSMRVALEHHMGPGGYPRMADWSPSALSEVVAVADCFVSLQTHRSERGRSVTPFQALGMMLGPLLTRFDPALLGALVRAVGLFPPGQMIELDDGALAVVLAPNVADLGRPHVRLVRDSAGAWADPAKPVEYRPLPAERGVRRVLRAEEYPETPPQKAA